MICQNTLPLLWTGMVVGPRIKGKNRINGHSYGVKAVQEVVEEAVQLKIDYLTLYAFSTENWSRPQEEIGVLMKLLVNTLRSEFEKLLEKPNQIERLETQINFPIWLELNWNT